MSAKLIHVSGFMDFLNPAIQDHVGKASVIIFQRNVIDTSVHQVIRYWQGMGKPVVVDLDDAYHILPWSNPAHQFWIQHEEGIALQHLEDGLSISDGLIAPNRLLLSDWAHVCKGYYLPNFAERKWWENLPTRQEAKEQRGLKDRIVIGWGGSVSHYDSWWGSGLMEAAKRISVRHPEVTWMICGNDTRMLQQLEVSPYQKYLQPGVEPGVWPSVVKTFDIGIAPLFGPYDQRRSWIKGLEYMLAEVPWIGTIGEPYRDLTQFGKLIKNGADNWEISLETMITDLVKEQERAKPFRPIAEQWFAENQINTFKAMFETIVKEYQIERTTGSRLPGVAYV